jgi:hypothetical protein
MVDGIVMRALGYVPNGKNGTPAIANEQRSREFANMGLLEMGAELAGVPNSHRMSRARLFEDLVQRSMLGSSDYPLLLSAAANKFLLAQYQYQSPSYRSFSAKKTFNDFKAHITSCASATSRCWSSFPKPANSATARSRKTASRSMR